MIHHTIEEILAKMTEANTKQAGLIEYTRGLRRHVADVLAGTAIPATTQERIDQLFQAAEDNASASAKALEENVTQGSSSAQQAPAGPNTVTTVGPAADPKTDDPDPRLDPKQTKIESPGPASSAANSETADDPQRPHDGGLRA